MKIREMNKYIKLGGLWLISVVFVLLIAGVIRIQYVTPSCTEHRILAEETGTKEKVTNGGVVQQEFILTDSPLEQIGIRFRRHDSVKAGSVIISLREKGSSQFLVKQEIPVEQLENKAVRVVGLEVPVLDGEGRTYVISVQGKDLVSSDKELRITGFDLRGEVDTLPITMWKWMTGAFLVFAAILCLAATRRWALEWIYLPIILTLGLLYIFIIPVQSAPDEQMHTSTCIYYTNQILGMETLDQEGYTIAPGEYTGERYGIKLEPDHQSYLSYFKNLGSTETDSSPSRYYWPLNSSFVGYLPQIAGMLLARIMNLNGLWVGILPRLFALLFYGLCTTLAIRLMPVGKMAMMAVALLPISVQQGMAISYDCVIHSLCFLFIAYVFHLAYKKDKVNWKQVALAGLLLSVPVALKVVYIMLAVLPLFFLTRDKITMKTGKAGVAALSFGIPIVVFFALTAGGSISYLTRDAGTVAWSGLPTYTMGAVLADPIKVVALCVNTWLRLGWELTGSMIGNNLCRFHDVYISDLTCIFFLVILLLSTVYGEGDGRTLGKREMAGAALAVLGVAGGVVLSMLLGCTSMEDVVVQGIQGRYFLPALPVLLLLLRNQRLTLKGNIDHSLIWCMGILQVSVLAQVFGVIISR